MANLSRSFEIERARRTLMEASDPDQLRQIGLMLLKAWDAQSQVVEQLCQKGWLPR